MFDIDDLIDKSDRKLLQQATQPGHCLHHHLPPKTSTYTLCSKKSDAKIQITTTTAYLIRIKYFLSGFNYHLSNVNVANFNKIHHTVSEQQLF